MKHIPFFGSVILMLLAACANAPVTTPIPTVVSILAATPLNNAAELSTATTIALATSTATAPPTATTAPTETATATNTNTPTETATATEPVTETSTPTSTATATHTQTPTNTSTPDAKAQLVKYFQSPAAQQMLIQYATAMNFKPEDVIARLEQKNADIIVKDSRQNSFETLVDPQTGVKLFIRENGIWQVMTIAKVFALRNKELQVRAEPGGGKQIPALKYFPDLMLTTTSDGWLDPVEPSGEMDFTIPDYFAGITQNRIVLDHMAWGYKPLLKPWVIALSADQQRARIRNNITTIMSHFLRKFGAKKFDVTVAAEAASPSTLYNEEFGPGYDYLIEQYQTADSVMKSFNRTRSLGADRLTYSDFIGSTNDPRLREIIEILKLLKSKNLIDVFYLQVRYVGQNVFDPLHPPSRQDLQRLCDEIYGETGVPVMFAEVGIKGDGDIKTIFGNTVGGCMDSQACMGVQINSVGGTDDDEEPISIFTYSKNGKPFPNQGYYEILGLAWQ